MDLVTQVTVFCRELGEGTLQNLAAAQQKEEQQKEELLRRARDAIKAGQGWKPTWTPWTRW